MPPRIPNTAKTRKGAKVKAQVKRRKPLPPLPMDPPKASDSIPVPRIKDKGKGIVTPDNPQGAGRTEAIIDLERVDRMLMAGCAGTTIAKAMGIHADTLYRRIKEVYGVSDFAAYAQQMRAAGDDNLKLSQFTQAMKGNPIMLIWLGKNRLGQADKVETKGQETYVIDFRRSTPAAEQQAAPQPPEAPPTDGDAH